MGLASYSNGHLPSRGEKLIPDRQMEGVEKSGTIP